MQSEKAFDVLIKQLSGYCGPVLYADLYDDLMDNLDTTYTELLCSIALSRDINCVDDNGNNLCMLFSATDSVYGYDPELKLELLKKIIEAGCNINAKNDDGQTALMIASKTGCSSAMELLFKAGADVNIKDKNNLTALEYVQEDEDNNDDEDNEFDDMI